jgi:hypothetical protein
VGIKMEFNLSGFSLYSLTDMFKEVGFVEGVRYHIHVDGANDMHVGCFQFNYVSSIEKEDLVQYLFVTLYPKIEEFTNVCGKDLPFYISLSYDGSD